MINKMFLGLVVLLFGASSCYQPERNCKKFQNGKFSFSTEINGETKTTIFTREDAIEIDEYEGRIDTSSVRWINDCEYIVKKLHPRNMAEEKSIHMKILSTSEDSYTFEYSVVGSAKKSIGTAIKIQ
ncbi:DNA topoisomerase IV [Arenibacter sp. 6A1]|uniref:DNA topoisomerase IV n=1 Tax=Arenibacter sp. 6A1 TaxID=2720391 RepID=UPI00144629D5|nr:DNA topoisomerase IV [Arenibacter sp. 6A1]NKI25035.1 DNA topoisomerase IV [Arenibacter sp. 6A1]